VSQTEILAGSLDTGVNMTTHRTDETMAPRQDPPRGAGGGNAQLTVLAGPTAVGKGTVAAEIRERFPDIWISVSATTRKARPNEVHGVHYLFVSDEEFDRMIADGELLEWAVVHKAARYGTPKQPVLDKLAEGRPALLEIDLQGARQVRETIPDALFVFLAPPSWDELVRRLIGRGTETEAERDRRLATAREELAAEAEFDVTLVNTDVETVCEELVALMRTPHLTSPEA
jgi:guanylate kinase